MDMFSMAEDIIDTAPAFSYPEVRPYTLREMLILEKEASGMFFSGQLLDDFSKCVEALAPMQIAEIAPSDEDSETDTPALPDRAKVKIAGIVSGVTLKTTKKEERMAFFTVEDSGGVIECLAFPKTFTQYGEIIKADNAVFVEGNLSVREEESPKVLVSVMGLLVDNAHFNGSPKPAEKPAPKPAPAPTVKPQQATPAPKPAAEGKPAYNPYESMPSAQAPKPAYNPYESMPSAQAPKPAYNPYESMPAPKPTPAAPPQKLYLRVPDREGEAYKKALNLAEIFCDGTTAVIFYDMSDGKYYASNLRMKATPFVLTRLEGILGKENVVAK